MVLVDNKVESYASHLENGIPITDFLGDSSDEMLIILERYLLTLKGSEDVRKVILKDFCLERLQELMHPQQTD